MTEQARQLVPDTARTGRTPPVLLPYQQRWLADTSPLKVGEKGRRTGLTWAEAADAVLIAASAKSAGGQNYYYLGTDKEMTEEFIEACAMWATAFNHAAGQIEEGFWDEAEADEHILRYTIRFPGSGHKITALASVPRKLRGRQGVVGLDEAAFMDNLKEMLKAALAFIAWGGKVRVWSTHDGVDNPFNELINEIRAGKRKGTVHRIAFRDAVDEGLYKRICLRLGKTWSQETEKEFIDDVYSFYGDAAEEELDCVPRNSAGAYLSRVVIEQRMDERTPVLQVSRRAGFEAMDEYLRRADIQDWLDREVLPLLERLALVKDQVRGSVFGVDFGRYVDLSVMVPLLEGHNLKRRPPFAIEMRNLPIDQQRQVVFFVADRLPKLRAGALDATGNGLALAEFTMQRYGPQRISQVMISDSFYAAEFPKLRADLEDGTLDGLPKTGEWMDDLRAVETVKGIPKIPAKRTTDRNGGKRHGDAAVAVLLANSVARMDVIPIEYHSIGRRSTLDPYGDRLGAGFTADGWGSVGGGPDTGGFQL